jgi:N-acetylmuramoyl-L-alanine amidase
MRRRLLVPVLVPVMVAALLAVPAGVAGAHPEGDPPQPGPGEPAGVLVTPTGQVVPLGERHATGWMVTTPCNAEAYLTAGTVVPRADVVLDPGHGGSESGAVGSNGLTEKALNLTISFKVQQILQQEHGLVVQLTRTTDVRVPLRVRAAIAEALRPRAFVSIHHNGGATRVQSQPGTEVYHQIASSESRRLGGILYEEISRAMARYPTSWVGTNRKVSSRIRRDGTDLYGVLRNAPNVPSVITEALYLSNPPEARLLATTAVQDAQARAIATGIVRFLTTADPGSGFTPPFVDESTTGTGGVDGCRDPQLGTPTIPVYTGYTEEEMATIRWAAGYLGMDVATFQKTGVYVVDFLRGLRGRPQEPPLEQVPWIHGPVIVTSTWAPTERPVLERTVHGYSIGQQEAQKLGVGVLAYLVGRAASGG